MKGGRIDTEVAAYQKQRAELSRKPMTGSSRQLGQSQPRGSHEVEHQLLLIIDLQLLRRCPLSAKASDFQKKRRYSNA